jgi:hypothetical protein
MRSSQFLVLVLVATLKSRECSSDFDSASTTLSDYEVNHTIILTYPYRTVESKLAENEDKVTTTTVVETDGSGIITSTQASSSRTPLDLNSFFNFNVSASLINSLNLTLDEESELIGQLYSWEDYELVKKQIEILLTTEYAIKNESNTVQNVKNQGDSFAAGVFADEKKKRPKLDLKSLVPLDKLINFVLEKQMKSEMAVKNPTTTTKENSLNSDGVGFNFEKKAESVILTSILSSTTTLHTTSTPRPIVSLFSPQTNRINSNGYDASRFRISTTSRKTSRPPRVFEFNDPNLLMNTNINLNGRNFTIMNVTELDSDSFDAFHYIGTLFSKLVVRIIHYITI